MLSLACKSCRTVCFPCDLTRAEYAPDTIQKHTMPSAAHPRVRQNGALRRPKCGGRGRSVIDANRIALATKIASSATVRATPAVVPLDPTIATITVPTIAVPTIPVPKAAGPYQAGHRG